VRFFVLLLLVFLAVPAGAEPDGPIRLLFGEVQRVEDDSGTGTKLLARIALDNTARRHVEEWSSTLLWIDAETGDLLCAVEVAIGVPLSTHRPMEVYLELSSLTECESGVLAGAPDRSARLETLDVRRIIISKGEDTLSSVAEPWIHARDVLTPATVEITLGRNEQVEACLLDAAVKGYVDCGKIWIQMTVHPDGTIHDVEPDPTCVEASEALDSCLRAAFDEVRFPPFDDPPKTVRYPYSVRWDNG